MIRFLVFFAIFGFPIASIGQIKENNLQEVVITSSFNKASSDGAFVIQYKPDSNYILTDKTSAEVLQEDGIYLKAYNSGGLVTAGNRGFGASQTRVFWNGFMVNSPLNGTMDLNLLGIHPASSLIIFNKSNSPVEGNISGPGGSIWIYDQIPQGNESLRFALAAGSFSTFKGSGSYTFRSDIFRNHSRVSVLASENDYKYRPVIGFNLPKQKLANADVKQISLNNSTQVVLPRLKLDIRLNYNRAQRGIPPPITASDPISFQLDESFKAGISGQHYFNGHSGISFNAGYLFDILHYFPIREVKSSLNYYVTSIPVSLRWEYRKWNHALNFHLNQTAYHVNSSEIVTPDEHLTVGTLELKRDDDKVFDYGMNVQQMLRNGEWIKPSYRIYVGSRPGKNLNVTLAYAVTKQLATLNDRYWPISGNPDLLTETDRSIELVLRYKNTFINGLATRSKIALFHNQVDDWIAWIQVAGDFWRPFNVQKVKSLGLDLNSKWDYKINEKAAMGINYNLNLSNPVVTRRYQGGIAQVGKRLIYVPLCQQSVAAQLTYGRFSLRPSLRYASSRYTTADNSIDYALDPYVLVDCELNYTLKIRKARINTMFKVENIFDYAYEMIAYRPMPGRYFELGFGVGL
ncbi:MAG: TonB-dependent receptor [Saprospiraceae bacterium]|nr:TonB-dependent receptor [Saprospiraceae bacterium]